ncbi:unnamed protein product [Porites evermanni]|uniref:Uncharacterized protein n=1 Tax=Porites evermanni TaxID=104178 RepID=A0ABN8T077_9CNID|nr:unnamed protein product [Porites evermanni]
MSGCTPSDVESEQGNKQDSEKNTVQQTEIVKNTVLDPDETPPELAVLSDGLGEKREVETRGKTKKRARIALPSSTFHQITPSKYLDLKHSGQITENWNLWEEKYNNYFAISRLDRETPEFQLAMFKHTIGDGALKVIKTFNYVERENSSDWCVVMGKMENHCIGEVNKIY